MDLLYLASIWGGIVTLAFLPLLCLKDWTTRQIPDNLIVAYLCLTIIPPAILYANGLTVYYFITSLVMMAVWVIFRKVGVWGGADTKFLMVYSLTVPLNPLNLYQTNFQISTVIYIGITMLVTAAIYRVRDLKGNDVPMMIPISAAILLTMLTGAFL